MSSKTILPIVTALCVAAGLVGYSFYQRQHGGSGSVSPVTMCIVISLIFLVPAAYDVVCRLRSRNKK